jgi:hypothetical protein
MMDGNKNKVYIPELMIGNENQTVIVTTPDGSIKQISVSLLIRD